MAGGALPALVGQRRRPGGTSPDRIAARRQAVAVWGGGIIVILAAGFLAVRAGGGMAAAPTLGVLALWLIWRDRFMRPGGGVPVLTWHSVSRDARWLPWAGNISVTPETLDRQLRLLRRMGCESMDSAAFVRRRLGGESVPDGTVLLHFDDGYLDNWVAAAPLLARHGMRATLFVSLDFIAPDRPPPATIDDEDAALRWDGYLSWAELRALEGGAFAGAFSVEAHGVDHGRIATGPAVVDHLRPDNWRRLAWMQWARMPGDKHDWYLADTPTACGYGTPVPQSAPALAGPGWGEAGRETDRAYRARVRRELGHCREAFEAHLGRAPHLFCWPQNRTSPTARALAAEAGYLATTAGTGTNCAQEDPSILSRVHVGERVLGFRCVWADDVFLRATVLSFRGNHYWYLPVLALALTGRLTGRLTRRLRVAEGAT